jgi:hypothetical protein
MASLVGERAPNFASLLLYIIREKNHRKHERDACVSMCEAIEERGFAEAPDTEQH